MKLFNFEILTRNQKELHPNFCPNCLQKTKFKEKNNEYICTKCNFRIKKEELKILTNKGIFLDFNDQGIMTNLHLIFDHHYPYHTKYIHETATYLIINFLETIKRKSQITKTPFFALLNKKIQEYTTRIFKPNVYINHLDIDSLLSLLSLNDPEFALQNKEILINSSIGSDTGLVFRRYKKYIYPLLFLIQLYPISKLRENRYYLNRLLRETKRRILHPENYRDEFAIFSTKTYNIEKNIFKYLKIYHINREIILITFKNKNISEKERFIHFIALNNYLIKKNVNNKILVGFKEKNFGELNLQFISLNYYFIKKLTEEEQLEINNHFYNLFKEIQILDQKEHIKQIQRKREYIKTLQFIISELEKLERYIKKLPKDEKKEFKNKIIEQLQKHITFFKELYIKTNQIMGVKNDNPIKKLSELQENSTKRYISLIKQRDYSLTFTIILYIYFKIMLEEAINKEHYFNQRMNLNMIQILQQSQVDILSQIKRISSKIDQRIKQIQKEIKKLEKYNSPFTFKSNLIGTKTDSNLEINQILPFLEDFLKKIKKH